MGPDHPQIEIYDESKHGIAFRVPRADVIGHCAKREKTVCSEFGVIVGKNLVRQRFDPLQAASIFVTLHSTLNITDFKICIPEQFLMQ